jgi:hypothetical protein
MNTIIIIHLLGLAPAGYLASPDNAGSRRTADQPRGGAEREGTSYSPDYIPALIIDHISHASPM